MIGAKFGGPVLQGHPYVQCANAPWPPVPRPPPPPPVHGASVHALPAPVHARPPPFQPEGPVQPELSVGATPLQPDAPQTLQAEAVENEDEQPLTQDAYTVDAVEESDADEVPELGFYLQMYLKSEGEEMALQEKKEEASEDGQRGGGVRAFKECER